MKNRILFTIFIFLLTFTYFFEEKKIFDKKVSIGPRNMEDISELVLPNIKIKFSNNEAYIDDRKVDNFFIEKLWNRLNSLNIVREIDLLEKEKFNKVLPLGKRPIKMKIITKKKSWNYIFGKKSQLKDEFYLSLNGKWYVIRDYSANEEMYFKNAIPDNKVSKLKDFLENKKNQILDKGLNNILPKYTRYSLFKYNAENTFQVDFNKNETIPKMYNGLQLDQNFTKNWYNYILSLDYLGDCEFKDYVKKRELFLDELNINVYKVNSKKYCFEFDGYRYEITDSTWKYFDLDVQNFWDKSILGFNESNFTGAIPFSLAWKEKKINLTLEMGKDWIIQSEKSHNVNSKVVSQMFSFLVGTFPVKKASRVSPMTKIDEDRGKNGVTINIFSKKYTFFNINNETIVLNWSNKLAYHFYHEEIKFRPLFGYKNIISELN